MRMVNLNLLHHAVAVTIFEIVRFDDLGTCQKRALGLRNDFSPMERGLIARFRGVLAGFP